MPRMSLGVPGIIAEVSGNGLWGEESVGEMTAGVERVMKHLGMISKTVRPAARAKPQTVTMRVPPAPVSGLWYPTKELFRARRGGRIPRRDQGRVRRSSLDDLLEGGWFHPLSADQPVGEQG